MRQGDRVALINKQGEYHPLYTECVVHSVYDNHVWFTVTTEDTTYTFLARPDGEEWWFDNHGWQLVLHPADVFENAVHELTQEYQRSNITAELTTNDQFLSEKLQILERHNPGQNSLWIMTYCARCTEQHEQVTFHCQIIRTH